MSGNSGPNIEEEGLVFAVDAANPKSYVSGDTTCNSLVSSNIGTIINTGPTDEFWDPNNSGSWVFDGTDDNINCGDFLSLSTELTVSVWVKVNTWITYDAFVVQENASGSFYLREHSSTLKALNFAIYQSDAAWKSIVVSGVAPASDWFHLVGVADGSYVRMYVDGVSVGTPVVYDGTIRTSTDDLVIGDTAAGGRAANCQIANTLIYTRGLSASEILQNYNVTKSRFV